jgi:hypothetical protein
MRDAKFERMAWRVTNASSQNLVEAIACLAGSLEFLHICLNDDLYRRQIDHTEAAETFKDFKKLARLEVHERIIIKRGHPNRGTQLAELLPPNIQVLSIYHPKEDIVWWLGELLIWRTTYPLLGKVELFCASGWEKRGR